MLLGGNLHAVAEIPEFFRCNWFCDTKRIVNGNNDFSLDVNDRFSVGIPRVITEPVILKQSTAHLRGLTEKAICTRSIYQYSPDSKGCIIVHNNRTGHHENHAFSMVENSHSISNNIRVHWTFKVDYLAFCTILRLGLFNFHDPKLYPHPSKYHYRFCGFRFDTETVENFICDPFKIS